MSKSASHPLLGNCFVVLILSFFVTIPAPPTSGQEPVPDSPTFQLFIQTIHTNGKDILMVKQVPSEGKPVQQTYTVSVPYTENGVVKTRTETLTRLVQPTRAALSPIADNAVFQNLAGEKLNKEAILSKIPKTGLQIVVADPNLKEVPAAWKDVLNAKIVIMQTPPPQ